MHCRDTLQITCCALTAMIAMVYGAHFDYHPLTHFRAGRKVFSTRTENDVLAVTITLCTTAEFWSCFGLIKSRIPLPSRSRHTRKM